MRGAASTLASPISVASLDPSAQPPSPQTMAIYQAASLRRAQKSRIAHTIPHPSQNLKSHMCMSRRNHSHSPRKSHPNRLNWCTCALCSPRHSPECAPARSSCRCGVEWKWKIGMRSTTMWTGAVTRSDDRCLRTHRAPPTPCQPAPLPTPQATAIHVFAPSTPSRARQGAHARVLHLALLQGGPKFGYGGLMLNPM